MSIPKPALKMEEMYHPERYIPYRLLWLKVIIRAAYDYALWKDLQDLRHRKFAEDARKWLFEPSNLEFSFTSLCAKFCFPVTRLREFAKNLTKEDVKKLEFRERHGRDPIQTEVDSMPDLLLNGDDDGEHG